MVDHWSRSPKSGVNGDPTFATKEKGKIIFEAVVSNFVKFARDFKNRPMGELVIIIGSPEFPLHREHEWRRIADLVANRGGNPRSMKVVDARNRRGRQRAESVERGEAPNESPPNIEDFGKIRGSSPRHPQSEERCASSNLCTSDPGNAGT